MSTVLTHPRAYGYLRVEATFERHELVRWLDRMRVFARGHELTLEHVFLDTPASSTPAFERLLRQLEGATGAVVIVPALSHFTRVPDKQHSALLALHALDVDVRLVGE